MDINPASAGHALVIPKYHAPDIYETPDEWVAACMATVARVARAVRQALAPHGLNVVQANGPGAAQSVMHFHVHVLPRQEGDSLTLNWDLRPGDMGEIEAVAAKIRAEIA